MKTKEKVTVFDFENAFKALSEIDLPKAEKKQNNLTEHFVRSNVTNALLEDYYDVSNVNELEQAQDNRQEEIAQAKLARIEKIVDINAESPEDILPSYVGKNIIQCPQCMTLFYKDPEDIEISEDDESVCNVSEVCQHCGNDSGYTLIGKVEAVEEESVDEELPVEEPVEETDVQEEENIDDEDVENVEEPTDYEETEEESLNLDLPEDEDLDKVEESLQLNEAVDKDLDDKLKAHNEYIEYLKEMIEKEEESLANAKNDFVKKSIQSRIDALKADLESALPEALKGEVETELPTAEEVELEATENKNEKEEVKESLTEDEEVGVKSSGDPKITYKIKYSYRYTDEQAKGDEPRTEVKTVSAPSYEEAENELYGSLSLNSKRPHEFTVLEVNGEKYDSYIKNLKNGTNAKDEVKASLKEDVKDLHELCEESAEELLKDFADSLDEDIETEEKLAAFEKSLEESTDEIDEEENSLDVAIANRFKSLNSDIEENDAKVVQEDFVDDVSSEDFKSMLNNPVYYESIESEDEEEFEELDECSLNEHISGYLTNVYENVNAFEATSCAFENDKLIVEGNINFNSGNIKKTSFEFIKEDAAFVGKNKDLCEGLNFTLNYKVENKSIVTESFKYKYNIGENLVEGIIRK